jgi:hypothetical protein
MRDHNPSASIEAKPMSREKCAIEQKSLLREIIHYARQERLALQRRSLQTRLTPVLCPSKLAPPEPSSFDYH